MDQKIVYSIIVLLIFISCAPRTTEKVVYKSNNSHSQKENSITNYGAYPDDGQDDTAAIEKALKAKNRTLYLPAGTFLISRPITIPNDIVIKGSANTIFKANKKIENILNLKGDYSIQNLHIENIIFDGNKLAKNCIMFYKSSFNSPSTLENCRFKNAIESGAVFKACQTSSYYNLRASKNGKHGFEFLGCNGLRIYSLSTVHNKGDGLFISKYEELHAGHNNFFSGGLEIFSLHSEQNGGNGCKIERLQSLVAIFGGWVEGNLLNGFEIKSSSVHINGIRMSARPPETPKGCYSVNISKSEPTSDVSITNCSINTGANNWHNIFDKNDSYNTIIQNLHRINGSIYSKIKEEILEKNLVTNALKPINQWDPWFKSKSQIDSKKTPEKQESITIIPNINNGGASSVIKSNPGDIIKLEFYVLAQTGTKMRIQINPESKEVSSEGNILIESFQSEGGWEKKSYYFVSEGFENNIWVRNTSSNKSKFNLGRLSAKKVLSFKKIATEFYGNMNPIYKEVLPPILTN